MRAEAPGCSRHASAALAALVLLLGLEARAEDLLPPQIVHEACEHYQKGKDFVILARFYDDSRLFEPKVMYRSRRASHWKNAPFRIDPETRNHFARIKERDLRGMIEYFIEVFDENGNGPARFGSPGAPIRVAPGDPASACDQIPASHNPPQTSDPSTLPEEPEGVEVVEASPPPEEKMTALSPSGPPPVKSSCELEDRPVYCEPWFWVAVGGGVLAVGAGVGVGVYYLRTRDDPWHMPDYVALRVTGPDPTAAALRRQGAWP